MSSTPLVRSAVFAVTATACQSAGQVDHTHAPLVEKRQTAAPTASESTRSASATTGCNLLTSEEISAAKAMVWVNKPTFERGYANIILNGAIRRQGASWRPDGVHVSKHESLTQSQALEREGAQSKLRPATSADVVRLEIELNDGQKHAYAVPFEPAGVLMEGGEEVADYRIPIVIRPELKIIRVLVNGEVDREFVRPTHALEIEALMLSSTPLRIAMRARGQLVGTTSVFMREDIQGDIDKMAYYDYAWFNPHDPAMYPCWLLMPDAMRQKDDQGFPILLTIQDPFHEWIFRAERDK